MYKSVRHWRQSTLEAVFMYFTWTKTRRLRTILDQPNRNCRLLSWKFLAALYMNKKVMLFHRAVHPVGEIKTKVYENGSWKDGVKVISA